LLTYLVYLTFNNQVDISTKGSAEDLGGYDQGPSEASESQGKDRTTIIIIIIIIIISYAITTTTSTTTTIIAVYREINVSENFSKLIIFATVVNSFKTFNYLRSSNEMSFIVNVIVESIKAVIPFMIYLGIH
jgi:hypothetical protein